MVFQDFAEGGYATADFLTGHSDAGVMFRAFEFHAAILHFGTNDAGRGTSAEDYKAQTQQLIAMLRNWAGDASFPVVLMSDPFRANLPLALQTEFDRYAGAHLAIAQSDPNVLVVNSRRLMHDLGWNDSRPDVLALFLADDVHYTPRGAMELAAAEMTALLGSSP
jgi:lysophospholipase L1-like esterase